MLEWSNRDLPPIAEMCSSALNMPPLLSKYLKLESCIEALALFQYLLIIRGGPLRRIRGVPKQPQPS